MFFFGDNGRCLIRGKQWLYDYGTHVPLIVRWPGVAKAGAVRDEPCVALDMTASTPGGGRHRDSRSRSTDARSSGRGAAARIHRDRARSLRRDRRPHPRGARQPLQVHSQFHARAPLHAAERVHRGVLPDAACDEGAARGGKLDATSGALDGAAEAAGRVLRHAKRSVRGAKSRRVAGACAAGGEVLEKARRLDRADEGPGANPEPESARVL